VSNFNTATVMGWAANPKYPIVGLGMALRLPSNNLDDTATQEIDALNCHPVAIRQSFAGRLI
jgi:hypothetical protein